MNYTSFIVKILKKPKQSFLKNNIVVTKILVKFVSPRIKTFNIKDTFQISWVHQPIGKTMKIVLMVK